MGLGLKKLGKVAGAAAAGNPVGAVSALSEKKPPTPAEIVLKALESEDVQQAIRSLGTVTAQVDTPKTPILPAILSMDFIDRLKEHEGYNPVPHEVMGVWHCGYGHNLQANHPMEWPEMIKQELYSRDQCEEWLEDDIEAAEARVLASCNYWDVDYESLPQSVQEGLVEMAFQLGTTRRWKNMWVAIQNQEWESVASHALDSKWFKVQTPKRALDVAHFLSARKNVYRADKSASRGYLVDGASAYSRG